MSWFSKLKQGLSKSSSKLGQGLTQIFTHQKVDAETLEDLEDLLITADISPSTAATLTEAFGARKFDKEASIEAIKQALAEEIAALLEPVAQQLPFDASKKPFVVLVTGVNGSGKTTTIGKLAKQYTDQGYKVGMVAGDTFRAGAIEQLAVWAERTGAHLYQTDPGRDAAALAFDAYRQAEEAGVDILFVDTAGRLHNKENLMAELAKVKRVLQKHDPDLPHQTLLVLDATTGQAAVSQVKIFAEVVALTGLIVTKLDGTARGGVVVSLADQFGLPVYAVGIGEQAEDLQPFLAEEYAKSLVGQ